MGKEGEGSCPGPARAPVLWAGRYGRAAGCFTLGLRWASKPMTPLGREWTRGIPQSGSPGQYLVVSRLWERGLRERGSNAGESKRRGP